MTTHAQYPTGYGNSNDINPRQAAPNHPVFYNKDVTSEMVDRLGAAMVGQGTSFRTALARAILHADDHHARDKGEAVGAFLVNTDRWQDGVGWVCSFDYVPLINRSATPHDAFEVSNDELVDHMRARIEKRVELAMERCVRGFAPLATDEVILKEQIPAWFGPGSWKVAAESMEGGLNVSDAADLREAGLNPETVTAAQYMCITGPVTLAGLFHSHPSGSTDLSPQDFHGASVLDTWRQMFQYRLLGQSGDSRLETSFTLDNWIWCAPKVGGGDSALVRYDRRGKKSEWSGKFVA